MGFQLTISAGKEAGKEFVFEQASVTIGRTSDCDVILYDPGVSRKHARIFLEGEQYFVEDMGSSNGTKVNGSTVKKQALAAGDALTLGPVVFSFVEVGLGPEPSTDAAGVPDQSTRIVSLESLKPTGKAVAMAPPDAGEQELSRMARTATRSLPAAGGADPGHTVIRSRPSNPNVPAARAPATRSSASVPARVSSSSVPARAAAASAPVPASRLSAAERARIKRENKNALVAKAKLYWADADSKKRRNTVLGGVGAAVVLFGGLAAYIATRPPPVVVEEPAMLGRERVQASFGLSASEDDPVDFVRADMKIFNFDFVSPTRAVVILHYQASDVSDNEVNVAVNGQEVGYVPADTFSSRDDSHDILIPPALLKKGEPNQLVFDNVKNPPGEDPWRVWNLWVETIPLPEVPAAELLRDARLYFTRAQQNEEREKIGADNLFSAWKNYRTAWLMLEVSEDKPELYLLSRESVKRTSRKLDRLCAKLLLEVEQAYSHKDYAAASSTLEHVKEYFPDPKAHTCPLRAEIKRDELGLY